MDGVGLEVVELGVAAGVDGGGGIVGEVEELVNHIRAGLLGAAGLQVCAALHADAEFIPAAAVAAAERLQLRVKHTGDG